MKTIVFLLTICACAHPLLGLGRKMVRTLAVLFGAIGGFAVFIGGPLSFISNAGYTVPVCGAIMIAASILIATLDDFRDS
jgi:hypothetical protein